MSSPQSLPPRFRGRLRHRSDECDDRSAPCSRAWVSGAERYAQCRDRGLRRAGDGERQQPDQPEYRGALRRGFRLRRSPACRPRQDRQGEGAGGGRDEVARGVHERETLCRLPRDARQAEGHRRHRRRDARSCPRDHREVGDATQETCVRAEATDALGARGAAAARAGQEQRCGDADGEPGALDQQRAPHQRMGAGGIDRTGTRGVGLYQSSGRILAAGSAAAGAAGAAASRRAVGRRDVCCGHSKLQAEAPRWSQGKINSLVAEGLVERQLLAAAVAQLGAIRRRAHDVAACIRSPPSIQLAWMGGLRRERDRRHGRAPHRSAVLEAWD